MRDVLANTYVKVLIAAAVFWLVAPSMITLYEFGKELTEAPPNTRFSPEPQPIQEGVIEHAVRTGWKIVQIFPPAIGSCEPIYYAVLSVEPFTPRVHTIYVPNCGEHRYFEQLEEKNGQKPAAPVQLTPASQDAGGFLSQFLHGFGNEADGAVPVGDLAFYGDTSVRGH